MKIRTVVLPAFFLALMVFAALGFAVNEEGHFSERVKVALRDSGNRLLLSNNDSTSLVLPIVESDKNKFELSFQSSLSINPDSLVSIVEWSLKTSNLPSNYILEVIRSNDDEVVYSYQISDTVESNIIPCIGRNLPVDRYRIAVIFTSRGSTWLSFKNFALISLFSTGFIGLLFFYGKKDRKGEYNDEPIFQTQIGSYKFCSDQNKLIRKGKTIKLTSKECELLHILSKNQNQIVKRADLIKEVWEDNGVYVGRSLDTFISKIRKKLVADNSIKITNVHGVGYKLETSQNGGAIF